MAPSANAVTASPQPTRVVVLGGGVGGLAAARELERRFGRRAPVEITLVSRDNFFLLSPLLFEACSGVLELRHCAQPIRPCLRRARVLQPPGGGGAGGGPGGARSPARAVRASCRTTTWWWRWAPSPTRRSSPGPSTPAPSRPWPTRSCCATT